MPRLQIDVPERFRFSTEITIYTGHINQGGHLDNALLLALVSEARRRYFKSLSYTESSVEGRTIAVADSAVIYRTEAFAGEVLVFRMDARDYNKYGCDLVWIACETITGREVARGKQGIVFLEQGQRKVVPIPPAFVEKSSAA